MITKSHIQALIFDLYGVIGSDQSHIALNKLSSNISTLNDCKSVLRACDLGLLSHEMADQQIAEILQVSIEQWQDTYQKSGNRDEKLLETIENYKKSYKTGLITNASSRESVLDFFEGLDINNYFDECIISGEVGYVKPDPKIFEICMQKLQLAAASCVFIDDRIDFCEAAEKVGMATIHYTSYQSFMNDLQGVLR